MEVELQRRPGPPDVSSAALRKGQAPSLSTPQAFIWSISCAKIKVATPRRLGRKTESGHPVPRARPQR